MNVLSYIQYASATVIPIFSHVGLTTTFLESVATSIGAGMLLGGFAVGAAGLLLGWARRDLEARALGDGYMGGIFAVVLVIFDLMMRYVV